MKRFKLEMVPTGIDGTSTDGAIVEVTGELAHRIRYLAEIVKREALYIIEEFNYNAEWYQNTGDDDESQIPSGDNLDCFTIQVASAEVRWTALWDDVVFATVWVEIDDLPTN